MTTFGQILGGAGRVAAGMTAQENSLFRKRLDELQVQEANRVAMLKQQIAQGQYDVPQSAGELQFAPLISPGQTMPMGEVAPPVATAPVPAPAPVPASAPAPAPAATTPAGGQPQPVGLQYPAGVQRELSQARMRLEQLKGPWYLPTPDRNRAQIAATQQEIARLEELVRTQVVPVARAEYQRANPLYVPSMPYPGERPATPAAAPAEPGKPTKAAQQYDATTTPYDAIITQSAQQYGIDPVVFKRLIGTESSFSPTAVSPRGEKFGLGIAQIADVHGLTREQKLDPNTAIPFAAQLFSQYLQQSGGNYEQALQKYKGASSAGGKAAMSGQINTILSGVVPSAQAATATPGAPAAGAAPTPLEVPRTQARNMEMAEFYLANPQSIPYEQQQLQQFAQQQAAMIMQKRNEAARMAQMYRQSGTAFGIQQAEALRSTIDQADAALLQIQQQVGQKQVYLQGMQGLRELATANDPRRLAGVLTQYMGVPVGIQPRPDGKYNYFVNGKKVQDGVSPAQLAAMALKEFSPEARQAASASAALENELALKRKYGDAMVNAMKDIQKAIIDGEYKIAEERAKQAQGNLTIDTSKGVAYFQQGNRVFVINPDGKVEETPLGKVELPPTARPVAGLNMGR